jgi:hypothetical protein
MNDLRRGPARDVIGRRHGEFRVWNELASDATDSGRRKFATVRSISEFSFVTLEYVLLVMRRGTQRAWFKALKQAGNPPIPTDWVINLPCAKACGKPVDELLVSPLSSRSVDRPPTILGSSADDPGIGKIEANERQYRGLAILSVFSPSFLPSREREEAALRAAPSTPNLHSENADPTPPNPERQAALDQLRMLKARISAHPPTTRRRRTR